MSWEMKIALVSATRVAISPDILGAAKYLVGLGHRTLAHVAGSPDMLHA